MLTYAYLFSLIVGGVLLGASILLGSKDGGEVDDVGDHDHDHDHDHSGGVESFMLMFLSIRFWTFFLAFFGLTGIAIETLGLVSLPFVGAALSIGMGFGAGFSAVKVFKLLNAEESDSAVRAKDYVGKSARVLVPFAKGGTGQIRLQLKGNTVDVLATTDDDGAIATNEEVLVLELDGTKARVARMTDGNKSGGE